MSRGASMETLKDRAAATAKLGGTRLYTVAWLGWLVYFGVVESVAIVRQQRAGTLTVTLKRWASMDREGRAWRLRRFLLLALIAWLAAHFLSPGWF
jgi:hypothetical protein